LKIPASGFVEARFPAGSPECGDRLKRKTTGSLDSVSLLPAEEAISPLPPFSEIVKLC